MRGARRLSLAQICHEPQHLSLLSNLPFNYLVLRSLRKGRRGEEKRKTQENKWSRLIGSFWSRSEVQGVPHASH